MAREWDEWEWVYPYRRFTCDVTATGARHGAMVARYAFHVGLLHPLLYAGSSRRFLDRHRHHFSRILPEDRP